LCKAEEPGRPKEESHHHPSAWQEHKSSLSFLKFYNNQTNAFCRRLRDRFFPRKALVYKGYFHGFIGSPVFGEIGMSEFKAGRVCSS